MSKLILSEDERKKAIDGIISKLGEMEAEGKIGIEIISDRILKYNELQLQEYSVQVTVVEDGISVIRISENWKDPSIFPYRLRNGYNGIRTSFSGSFKGLSEVGLEGKGDSGGSSHLPLRDVYDLTRIDKVRFDAYIQNILDRL